MRFQIGCGWHFGQAAQTLACLVILSGCASPATVRTTVDPAAAEREAAVQRKLLIERQLRDQLRVSTVSYPILQKSRTLCGQDVGPTFGMYLASTYDFTKELRTAAAEVGIQDRITVAAVTLGGPAEIAGLQSGDVVVSIDDWPVPSGKKATDETLKQMRKTAENAMVVKVSVERGGSGMVLPVEPVVVCDYPAIAIMDDQVNAFADGKRIMITAGMLRFVENDQELATVIAHELAHNAMRHMDAKSKNAVFGSLFDILAAVYGVDTQGAFGNAGAMIYSQEFEAEADYVGVYVLALSDVPLEGVANLWRRMGASGGNIRGEYGASHPGSAERYIAIENAVQEVATKRTLGEPLVPNLKEGRKPPSN